MNKTHRSEFIKAVKDKFPELTDSINEQDGLLTFEMEVFIRFLQRQISDGERATTKECFDLLNYHYLNGNKALKETIRNAVCEDIDFSDSKKTHRSWALAILPSALNDERNAWNKFMDYKE